MICFTSVVIKATQRVGPMGFIFGNMHKQTLIDISSLSDSCCNEFLNLDLIKILRHRVVKLTKYYYDILI